MRSFIADLSAVLNVDERAEKNIKTTPHVFTVPNAAIANLCCTNKINFITNTGICIDNSIGMMETITI